MNWFVLVLVVLLVLENVQTGWVVEDEDENEEEDEWPGSWKEALLIASQDIPGWKRDDGRSSLFLLLQRPPNSTAVALRPLPGRASGARFQTLRRLCASSSAEDSLPWWPDGSAGPGATPPGRDGRQHFCPGFSRPGSRWQSRRHR